MVLVVAILLLYIFFSSFSPPPPFLGRIRWDAPRPCSADPGWAELSTGASCSYCRPRALYRCISDGGTLLGPRGTRSHPRLLTGHQQHNHLWVFIYGFIIILGVVFFSPSFCARMFEAKGKPNAAGSSAQALLSLRTEAMRSDFKESIVKIQLREPRKIIATSVFCIQMKVKN